MTMTQVPAAAVIVGSYSLESLTTGMYENPLHCMREYVQNGYDAIRAARSDGLLGKNAGLVSISIGGTAKHPTITIKDDGIGIPAEDAVSILVSVGASRKWAGFNAGFRGIGRLAGIAYCGTLRFTTTAVNEDVATIVEFDCGRLRSFMRPSAKFQEVSEVIRQCASSATRPAPPEAHGTEVEMIGLTGVGVDFAEIEMLVPYLRQICPVDYSDRFSAAPRIRAFCDSINQPLGAVEVETRYKREKTQILKAYDDSSPTSDARKSSTIADVELINNAELGWHGWIGKSNFKGELTDDMVAGVRFRVKNIQIDGSDLIETLAAELTQGGTEGRLQRWAVGEVFITNPGVVPNARRDGFEDGKAWADIRADIKAKVARRVVTLVREASKSRKSLATIALEIGGISRGLSTVERLSPEQADAIVANIERVLLKLRPDKLTGGNPDEVGNHISTLKTLRELVAELRSRPQPEPGPQPEPEPGSHPEGGEGNGDGGDNGNATDQGRETSGHGAEGVPPEPRDWPSADMLRAVREILVADLGKEQTDRIFARADNLLAREAES